LAQCPPPEFFRKGGHARQHHTSDAIVG
jgi:hypothetical protein